MTSNERTAGDVIRDMLRELGYAEKDCGTCQFTMAREDADMLMAEIVRLRNVEGEHSAAETPPDSASVLAWAVRSFGPIALNRDERAARMAEEAIEVAQVEGVPLDVMQRITVRVYSRPVGELGQEIGGLMVGLVALAARAGIDMNAEFNREFTRVLLKPADHWARKHAEKVAAGTADLSPVVKAECSLCAAGMNSFTDPDTGRKIHARSGAVVLCSVQETGEKL